MPPRWPYHVLQPLKHHAYVNASDLLLRIKIIHEGDLNANPNLIF